MSTEKSVREIVDEWNAKAKAAGRYLDRDPGSIPPAQGSLLDVPETPETLARIAWLKQQIADLQRQQQVREQAASTGDGVNQEVQAPLPTAPAAEEQPSRAGHA
jgi:hypothetical protein